MYISRDGGLNWKSTMAGAHIYELGDHGSIIVAAKHDQAVQEIDFSWDEGLTWESVKIFDTPCFVENIITEPNSISQQLIVYGVAALRDPTMPAGDQGGAEWVDGTKAFLTYLDFSFLHKKQCSGADSPGSAKSDYELWTPNDGRHGSDNKCFLGQ